MRISRLAAALCIFTGALTGTAHADPYPTLTITMPETAFKAGDPMTLQYNLQDGDTFDFHPDKSQYWAGVAGYTRGAASIYYKGLTPDLADILSTHITQLGQGEFTVPTEYIPFRRGFHRHLGFAQDSKKRHYFFVQRDLMPPPHLIRSDKSLYQFGEPITLSVSDDISFLYEDHWLAKNDNARPVIEVWRAPREVPGGAVELPKLVIKGNYSEITGDDTPLNGPAKPVKGYSYTLDKHENFANGGMAYGHLPQGHYDILLTLNRTVIGQIEGGIQVIAPKRESIEALVLKPELDDDERNDQGVPLYDKFPTLALSSSLDDFYKDNGAVGIFRVGSHGELRQTNWIAEHSGYKFGRQSLLRSMKTSGEPLEPGLYEARFYIGKENTPSPGFSPLLLLHSIRFYLSEKALKDGNAPERPYKQETTELPSGLFKATFDKDGPYQIGEAVTLKLERDKKSDSYTKKTAEALDHSDLWVGMRKLGQYYANCAYEDDYHVGNMERIQKGKIKADKNGMGALLDMSGMPEAQFEQPSLSFPSLQSGQIFSQNALTKTSPGYDGKTPRITYKDNGNIILNPPDAPGRYAIDVYRSPSSLRLSGPNYSDKSPDIERIARFEFEVDAREATGLLTGKKIPAELRKTDLAIYYDTARHQLPGIVKSYMFTGGPLIGYAGDEAKLRLDTSKGIYQNTDPYSMDSYSTIYDYGVYRAVLNDYLLAESEPSLIVANNTLCPWVSEFFSTVGDCQTVFKDMPKAWPDKFLATPISWRDLVVPEEKWLMPEEACHQAPLPSFKLSLVRLDGETKVKKKEDWLDQLYGLLDFDDLDYEELNDYYLGYPFFVQVEFDEPPSAARVKADVSLSGAASGEVWLVQTEDNPKIYRSERAYYIGAPREQ